ncbi:putative basic helix-loop-helix leucine zipper transcription factor [Helianthus anomalus]
MKKVVEQLQKALDEQLLDGDGKHSKTLALENKNPKSKPKVERSTSKKAENSVKLPEPPKQDYIHVKARRGQATGSHSLAERKVGQQSFDMARVSFASQPTREYSNGSSPEWLHMQISGNFERST